ncbi:hypothetical protein CP8484711_2204, partial [Chlamydia psittaci 84-8471/1]
TLL